MLSNTVSRTLPPSLKILPSVKEIVVEEVRSTKTPLGWIPNKYAVSDIQPEIAKRLTVDMGIKVFTHQLKILPRWLDLLDAGYTQLAVGATGIGKTYAMAGMCVEMRRLLPERYPDDQVILVFTKKNVKVQTTRVFREFGVKNFLVVTYESMSSNFGELWIEWKTVMNTTTGKPELTPIWCPPDEGGPCLIICDECQSIKNEDSTRSLTVRQAGRAGYQIFFTSATPFSRAQHLRTIAVCMKPLVKLDNGVVLRLTDFYYPNWLRTISDHPELWEPKDMARAMKSLASHITHFEKISFAHKILIRQIVIPFASQEHRSLYDEAMEEYQQVRIKKDRDPLTGFAAILVAIRKFNQKSEILRAAYLARSSFECVNSKKRPINAIIACGFKDTLWIIKELLVTKYKVRPDEISIIEGGQTDKDRQENIDRFNREKSRYMLMMFTAGGAGLSLHHTKNKKYPSEMFIPPVWNSEDLVQVMGRPHRVNSMSTTYLNIIWFADTIEEEIADRVKGKCAALKEVVGKGESWVDGLDEASNSRSSTKQISAKDLYEKDGEDEDDEVQDTSILGATNDGNANALVHKLIV